jgi:hypothetical protein
MKVAVLGCGPAGLLATHAAVLRGHDPVVYSIATRSEMSGAMYLHGSVPDLTPAEPDGVLTYRKLGYKPGYARKVYHDPTAPCSWEKFEGQVKAWSLSAAYGELWKRYNGLVIEHRVNPVSMDDIVNEYPVVVSSVPAAVICAAPHHVFKGVNIWVLDGTAITTIPLNQIFYSGMMSTKWYRASNIFGYQSAEFGDRADVDKDQLKYGIKPTSHDCTCWSGRGDVLKVGRFGKWAKGELTHMAFADTYQFLEG